MALIVLVECLARAASMMEAGLVVEFVDDYCSVTLGCTSCDAGSSAAASHTTEEPCVRLWHYGACRSLSPLSALCALDYLGPNDVCCSSSGCAEALFGLTHLHTAERQLWSRGAAGVAHCMYRVMVRSRSPRVLQHSWRRD